MSGVQRTFKSTDIWLLSFVITITMMQVYIVYMGSLPEGEYVTSSQHQNILQEVVVGRWYAYKSS